MTTNVPRLVDAPLRAYSRSLSTVLLATQQAIAPAFREVYNTVGLTPPQWRVLRVLWEQDGRTISTLAEVALLDKPVVVGVVDRLTKAGLVVRSRDEKDRRQVFVWLTEAGREIRTVAGPRITAVYERLDQALTAAEWDTLYDLLDRVRSHDLRLAGSQARVNGGGSQDASAVARRTPTDHLG